MFGYRRIVPTLGDTTTAAEELTVLGPDASLSIGVTFPRLDDVGPAVIGRALTVTT